LLPSKVKTPCHPRPGTADVCFFSGLVAIARAKHPIPSRTRKLSAVAPMVLRLKTWESRSPPNLKRNTALSTINTHQTQRALHSISSAHTIAGWSSPVARQAHNLKVVGSNPTPATKIHKYIKYLIASPAGGFLRSKFLSTPGQRFESNRPG